MDEGRDPTQFELCGLRQPAAIWRAMVRAEPYLARYEAPRRRFGTLGLIQRIDRVVHAIADRGREDRAGLSFAAAEDLEGKLAAALAMILRSAASRASITCEASLTPETVVVCAACWRLAPVATQRGFRDDGLGIRALCAEHSPALRASNGPALRAARRRMAKIRALDLQIHVPITEFASIVADSADRQADPSWAAFLDGHFPRVARAHPEARADVRASFAALDSTDRPIARRRLHEALVTPIRAQRTPRSAEKTVSDVDVIPRIKRSAWQSSRGASLLYTMLRTRELWLMVEESPFHGGARRGAGRPRKRTEEPGASIYETRSAT